MLLYTFEYLLLVSSIFFWVNFRNISYLSWVGWLKRRRLIFRVSCAEISEDASMLAVGFADSRIKVWSLVPQKLKAMKSAEQLQDINLEAGTFYFVAFKKLFSVDWINFENFLDDVLQRIMEDRSAETTKTLIGHTRSVTKISFSPDKTLLISSSVDGTGESVIFINL